MNITAPIDLRELRGTVVLFTVALRVQRDGLHITGTVEFQPVYPMTEDKP